MRRDDIRRLTEQRNSVFAAMHKLNEAAEKESRSLTGEENEQFDKMATEFEELKEREDRATRLFMQQRDVEKDMTTPIEKKIGDHGDGPASYREYAERRHGVRREDAPEFRSAFYHYLSAQSLSDLDVEEHRALTKGTTTAGGFLVPTGFRDTVIRSLRDMGAVAQLANEFVTDSGETIQIPANTAHGTAAWLAESGGYTPSDETFAQLNLNAFKASTKVIVSEELLQDSAFDLEAFLGVEFGERLGVLENTAFIKGDGTGKPQGLLATNTASNLGSDVTAAAGAGNTTTFTYDALVTAAFALPRQYRQNASFIVSDGAARNLYLMKDTTGQPLWNVNVSSTGPDTFMGKGIYTDPDMPVPAIGNISVLFGDWRRVYTIRRARGIGMQRQNELHSDSGQVGFRAYERVDGRVVLAAAGIGLKHPAT